MQHDDMWVRELEQHKDVPGLIEALEHPDEEVRIHAAEALGRVGDEQAIPALTAVDHQERGCAGVGGGGLQRTPHSWGSRHNPGYVVRVSSSDEFRRKFPGTKGKQLAFDTLRKVKLPV